MRLLFVTPYLPPYAVGGAEKSTIALSRALRTLGHEVTMLTLRLGPAPADSPGPVEYVDVGVHAEAPGRPLRPRVFERPDVQWRVARAVRRLAADFDLVHCQTLHLLPGTFAGARAAEVPVAATIRDLLGVCPVTVCLLDRSRVPGDCGLLKLERECLPHYAQLYGTRRGARAGAAAGVRFATARARSALLRRCDAVFAVADDLASLYEDAGLLRPGTTRILPNIAEARSPQDTVRDTILYAGKVSHGKGMAYLLDAFEHARKEAPDLSLVVAGYADEAWSKRLERPGVDFRGSLAYDELARLYDRAKLAVVPSIWPEPFPRSALEAAAAGVPVVGTASGGIPLIVEHRRTGLLVPPRDAHALAAAILELWQDETSARRLGLAASEHVKATFSAARIAALAETFYADVVSRKALPSAQSALA